ncbi:MAG: histidinol-phosphatase [Firmicutes bacterium]|nr:histidinol-phosphatase [Bacillota bacterium]
MSLKCNFHTHTTFCDGRSTPEEVVISAIEKGFWAIGFSGHMYTPFDESYCMSKEGTAEYIKEIRRLRNVYGDRIKIFLGIESDYCSDEDISPYDYTIGSVHYVLKNGEYIPVDETAEIQVDAVNRLYNGDFLAFAEDYFACVSNVNGEIVGHLDLISKFNEDGSIFDETAPRYVSSAENAIIKLISRDMIFEINTGAMSRGYRKTPYPSEKLLRIIREKGGKIMINSDAHEASNIDFAFDEALALAKRCGFTEIYVFDGAFKKINI